MIGYLRRVRQGLVRAPYPLGLLVIFLGGQRRWTSWEEAYLWALEELWEVREKGVLHSDQDHRATELLDVLNCVLAMRSMGAPAYLQDDVLNAIPHDLRFVTINHVYADWRVQLIRRFRRPSPLIELEKIRKN